MSDPYIWLIFGVNGTGKSTFAVGEDPEDKVDFFEWDPGSYRRAATGIKHPARITVHRFRTPATSIESVLSTGSLGEIAVGKSGTAPTPSYKLEGWQDEYRQFLIAFATNCKGEGRPVIDTVTRLWLAVRQAFLEQLQDATGNERERLDQLRYTEPNSRMMEICEYPSRFGKDLVLIAHEDTVFGTNQVKPDTYKELPNVADVTLRFTVEDRKPVATIYKMAGGDLALYGRKIPEPTLAKVREIVEAAAKVRAAGMSTPESNEDLLKLAEAL